MFAIGNTPRRTCDRAGARRGPRPYEQRIGAGLVVACGALDRALEAFDRDRVRAGDHERLARAPGIERRADLAAHLVRSDQSLTVEMPAPLRKILVLELNRVGARLLEPAHRAHDIERVAVTGVRINDEMDIDSVAYQRHRVGDLAHAHEANVRPADGCKRWRRWKRRAW
jgi:hypothetical protein